MRRFGVYPECEAASSQHPHHKLSATKGSTQDAVMHSSMQACPYCTEIFSPQRSFHALWDSILCEVSDIGFVPSRGSLLPGWVLAIPREHALSSAALSPKRRAELHTAVHQVRRELASVFGRVTLFEHGPSAAQSVVGCGVDHVHIHLVPLSFDLASASKEFDTGKSLSWSTFRSWPDFYGSNLAADPYVAVTSGDRVVVGSGDIKSQFFRRVIASHMGIPTAFDWRSDPGESNVEQTVKIASKSLSALTRRRTAA
jgi:ATP adenylyltransferase